jgi:Lon protease-like protein
VDISLNEVINPVTITPSDDGSDLAVRGKKGSTGDEEAHRQEKSLSPENLDRLRTSGGNYFEYASNGIQEPHQIADMSPLESPDTPYSSRRRDTHLTDDPMEIDHADIPDITEVVRSRLAEETGILTCQICYHVFLDPVTTRCGHTFCRICLARSMDSSQQCPACRTEFPWPFAAGSATHHDPLNGWNPNYHLDALISICWPEEVAIRQVAALEEEKVVTGDMDLPLFVCCVSFPTQPTFLRVFEPRYRLMLRRIMRTPERSFGMVNFSRDATPPMVRYATLVQIERVVYTDDREIILKTVGLKRIRIGSTSKRDGYWVASTEHLSDRTLLQDSPLEQTEVGFMRALDPELRQLNFDPSAITLAWAATSSARNSRVFSRLLTKELLALAMEYVTYIQSRTEPSIQQSIEEERGLAPTSPTDFPWWFASVMRMSDDEGVILLKEDSARERMKLVVWWIMKRMRTVQAGSR